MALTASMLNHISKHSLIIILIFLLLLTQSLSSQKLLCHDYEKSALLQFKHSFNISQTTSSKVASWTPEGDHTDCCLWDGVECDKDTGHVVGLDISNSSLYGSINSNTSLFQLLHLQNLNLAYNDFNYSQIPAAIGHLSNLTHLNLSDSVFSGNIPPQIFHLTNLKWLEISSNYDPRSTDKESLLELVNPDLERLLGNLTSLEVLNLIGVKFFSKVPNVLANLSSLNTMILDDGGFYGQFPMSIFYLPNIEFLAMNYNPNLEGHFPDFQMLNNSRISSLLFTYTKFYGDLPDSIANLSSLVGLHIRGCNFHGRIPTTIGNLRNLIGLRLADNNFTGPIPSSIGNLSHLNLLDLTLNQLTGPNLSDISNNNLFHGPFPRSMFQLKNLEHLDLSYNQFRGILNFTVFSELKSVHRLYLSHNNLSVQVDETHADLSFPKLQNLGLASCNLTRFPHFLGTQDKLEWLDLSRNNISGVVPKWMGNCGNKTLKFLDLQFNLITGFSEPSIPLPWVSLSLLKLSSNILQGPLPIPQPSTLFYYVSNNSLTGEIPPLICNSSSLQVLDLSYNKLKGPIPECLFNFSSLQALNLKNNNLSGTIPETWGEDKKLRWIVLSQNNLEGRIPRSWSKCTLLENLDLTGNQISDVFPSWLAYLPNLRVLSLRSNKFHGQIKHQEGTKNGFPKLQIIDLSHNNFTGMFPSDLFRSWTTKNVTKIEWLAYMEVNGSFTTSDFKWKSNYIYSMTMAFKGVETVYEKVQVVFTAIDLSGNRLEGPIPDFIGNIKGLNLLNLSNNYLSGNIPTSLGNSTLLESLDLSQNKLVGNIPLQLTQLTFLAYFNVSYNNLDGLIPQGQQFGTYTNDSFLGNPNLCGNPLSRKCGNSETPTPSPEEDQGSDSFFEFGWEAVLMGVGLGLVIGIVIGYITGEPYWLTKIIVRFQSKRRGARKMMFGTW